MIEKFSWREFLIKDVLLTIIFALVFVSILPIRLARPNGYSMEPAYKDGELMVYQTNFLDSIGIERGDVILCSVESEKLPLIIKRVIAIEGDTIDYSISKVGVKENIVLDDGNPNGIRVIGEEQYYLIGDNYWNSYDSRYFGPIGRDEIVGKVIYPKR